MLVTVCRISLPGDGYGISDGHVDRRRGMLEEGSGDGDELRWSFDGIGRWLVTFFVRRQAEAEPCC